ncbi:MAG: ABC transporter substrate-binding protein [Candidatus Eremiobacteraeota bacterium]|nr:ABC transporter substrate-binding protein [Candidatus Eremiobacteraeota bacterium]
MRGFGRLISLGIAALFVAGGLSLRPQAGDAANEPYVIGAVVCESGPAATLGRPEADSIQLAVDEINKSGGVNGHPLQVTVIDDETSPANAVNATRRLVDQHVLAILGTSITQGSLAMVPIAQQAHIPMIAYASSATVIEPVESHQWIFKIPPTDTSVAQMMQKFMKAQGTTRFGAVYRNDDYGKTGIAHFSEAGKGEGFEVVASEAIDATATDATTQLTKLRAANPQGILVWSTLPSVYVVAKGYRQLSLGNLPLYFSDGAADQRFLDQAGQALNGAYIATSRVSIGSQLPNSDPSKKLIVHYVEAFNNAFPKDKPANMFGGFAYDSLYWLKQALAKSGPDPAKLREALEHVTYVGVSGTFKTSPQDHNGLAPNADVIAKVVDGKFVLIR